MERKFLKIFILIVGVGSVAGIVSSICLDLIARSSANEAVVHLAELAREGRVDSVLRAQQYQRRLLYSPSNSTFLKPLYDTTVRFCLLARELRRATPTFKTSINKERMALFGTLSFIRDNEILFSQKAIMLNYQDHDRGNHWTLDSFLNTRTYTERMKTTVETLTETNTKKQIQQRIENPPLMAVANGVKRRCKAALEGLDRVNPFRTSLITYPHQTPEKLIERYRAEPEEIIELVQLKVKGVISYIEDENLRGETERIIKRWRKGWEEGVCDCDELLSTLKGTLVKIKETSAKRLLEKALNSVSKDFLNEKNSFIEGLMEKAVAIGAKKRETEALIDRYKKKELDLKGYLVELAELVSKERKEWFKDFITYREHKFRSASKQLIETKLLEPFLGWRDCFNSEYALEKLDRLLPQLKEKTELLLEELTSPRLRYEEASFELNRLMSNFNAKRREVLKHIEYAIKAVEDDSVRSELLSEFQELRKRGMFSLEKFIKEKLHPKKVSVYPYDRYAGGLPYSVFVSPLLIKQSKVLSEADTFLYKIRNRKDRKRKRIELLIGNDKEKPPLPGLIHWLLSDALFPDDIRKSLLEVMDRVLVSDSESVEPLIERFREACKDERVVRRARLQGLKNLLEMLPPSETKMKWLRRLEGRMAMWKPNVLAILRSLRAVAGDRELVRRSLPMVLRGIIIRPEMLTHDHIALIKDYAKRAEIEIHKRRYALREQTAKTEEPSLLYNKVKPLIETVRSLKATEPFYPEEVVKEIEKIAEEHLLPTEETKRRLARLCKRLLISGDRREDFQRLRNELSLLRNNLTGHDLEEFNRISEELPLTWRKDLFSLLMRALGVSAYATTVEALVRLRDGLLFDYEEAKKEIAEFIDSEEFLHRSAFETLRQRVLKAVVKNDKNAESVERCRRMQRMVAELGKTDKPIEEMQKELSKIALEDGNVRLNFIQKLSNLVRGIGGMNEDTSHYLLTVLDDSVWGRRGCSPEAVRDALIKDIQRESVLYNLRKWRVTSMQRREDRRRKNLDGVMERAIESLLKRIIYLTNQLHQNANGREQIKRELMRCCSNRLLKKITEELSRDLLYVSAIYEVDDWRRRGAIRRAYIEIVGEKFQRIRETSQRLLRLIEGKEEEEIDYVSKEIIELCFALRRIKESQEHITYDLLFMQRMDENWRLRWIVEDFIEPTDTESLVKKVEQELKQRAVFLGIKQEW